MADAEAAYKKAIALRPGYWGGHNQLGTFYLRCNRFEEAIAAFERAEKLTPDNVMIPSNIGVTYQYLGRYDEALIAYDRSIRVKPNAAAFANRGALLYYVGRYDEAVDDFRRASAMNPDYFQVWVGLADALRWSTNEKDKAPDAYLKAIELAEAELAVRSRDPLTIAMLSTCYAKTGKPAKAVRMAKLAVELAPQTAQVNFVAGVAMEIAGNRESAVRLIGHALQHGYTEEEVARDPELRALVSETDLLTRNKGGKT
jgi:serine/threonine-protein kinase